MVAPKHFEDLDGELLPAQPISSSRTGRPDDSERPAARPIAIGARPAAPSTGD
jgi:hypothetical protein